jgi:acyl transferase domain-containing protein
MSPHADGDEGVPLSSSDGSATPPGSIPEASGTAKATKNAFVPMAICGMACGLGGGGICSSEDMWEFLINKGDGKVEVPSHQYNVDAFYSPVKKPGTVNTQHGYFIDDDLSGLDGSFFNMSAAEISRSDLQQR